MQMYRWFGVHLTLHNTDFPLQKILRDQLAFLDDAPIAETLNLQKRKLPAFRNGFCRLPLGQSRAAGDADHFQLEFEVHGREP